MDERGLGQLKGRGERVDLIRDKKGMNNEGRERRKEEGEDFYRNG